MGLEDFLENKLLEVVADTMAKESAVADIEVTDVTLKMRVKIKVTPLPSKGEV